MARGKSTTLRVETPEEVLSLTTYVSAGASLRFHQIFFYVKKKKKCPWPLRAECKSNRTLQQSADDKEGVRGEEILTLKPFSFSEYKIIGLMKVIERELMKRFRWRTLLCVPSLRKATLSSYFEPSDMVLVMV